MNQVIDSVAGMVEVANAGLQPGLVIDEPSLIAATSWSVAMTPHIALLYHAADTIEAVDPTVLANECEDMREQLLSFFHIEPKSKQETLLLSTRLVFVLIHARSRHTFGVLSDPFVLVYLMDEQSDPAYLGKFRHELAHSLWGSMYGEAPPLFNEGLAEYAYLSATGKSITDLYTDLRPMDSVPPLAQIAQTGEFWSVGGLYRTSATLIHYLVSTRGWDTLKALFLETGYNDSNIVQTFETVYGWSITEVDTAWRQFVGEHLPSE